MNYRPLGARELAVSEISFGAGPVPGLLTDGEDPALQAKTVACALEAGINWFDTAPTYGDGRSETRLGEALREAGADRSVRVATKVRLLPDQLGRINETIKQSIRGSLQRLGCERVALLQLHNAVTRERGAQPTSITVNDVLGRNGVLETFLELQAAGCIEHFGLTGLGDIDTLREVIAGGPWASVQLCIDILHPLPELLVLCEERGIGVLGIRVLAGGALAGQPPSPHTLKTKYFPLPRYEEDQKKAVVLQTRLPGGLSLPEAAIRFVLGQKQVATALIGFASPQQVTAAVQYAAAGPLPADLVRQLVRHQIS